MSSLDGSTFWDGCWLTYNDGCTVIQDGRLKHLSWRNNSGIQTSDVTTMDRNYTIFRIQAHDKEYSMILVMHEMNCPRCCRQNYLFTRWTD